MNKFKHAFLTYVNSDLAKKRQYFQTARQEIAEQNLKFLQLASISTVLLLLFFFLITPLIIKDWVMSKQHMLFLPAALFFSAVSVLYSRKRVHSYSFVTFLCLIFESVELTFLLLIDIFSDTQAPGSFFSPILIALPALFIFPIHLNYLLILAFETLYIILAASFKNPYIAQYDVFATLVALAFSLVITQTILHLRCNDFDLRLKYQNLSQQDFLSGILNKQAFETKSRRFMQTASLSNQCALLLLDLDDFKKINDSFGHYAGDQLLRQIGDFLQNIFRTSDYVGRFGGDEFIILLKGPISSEALEEKALFILNQLRSIALPDPGQNITCSIGGAISDSTDSYDDLFIKADKALYAAKNSGKNTYQLYS